MQRLNEEKAALLYGCLDALPLVYTTSVKAAVRSRMNVTFKLVDERLNDAFLQGAEARGLVALKGHRVVGGMRASIYNAMPLAGVQALVGYLREFASSHG